MDQPGRPPAQKEDFVAVATTEEEENNFDFVAARNHQKPISILGAVMHMIKGALGAGVLSGHVSYMTAGIVVAGTLNVALGCYMTLCLYLLVTSAQVLYRRTNIHTMTYADVVEAAFALFPNAKVKRFAKCFRILIDVLIAIDLFGSCSTYQLMIANTIKQLVENVHETDSHGLYGFPHLRVYMGALVIPIILICWIVHLKWLAPFSLVANALILLCIGAAVYYASILNPTFDNLDVYTTPYDTIQYCGMIVFAMSCAGVVIPVENNMREPQKFGLALGIAMTIIIAMMVVISASGYAAFGHESKSPITINFPMTTFNKFLKGFMALMIYVTHAINFWVPFNCVFYYIKRRHKSRFMMWELFYRALFVILIAMVGMVFPSIEALMGFQVCFYVDMCGLQQVRFLPSTSIYLVYTVELPQFRYVDQTQAFIKVTLGPHDVPVWIGNFCLSNIAFVFPNLVCLLTVWERPGLGTMNWRLWRAIVFIAIGVFLLICGSIVGSHSLFMVFKANI